MDTEFVKALAKIGRETIRRTVDARPEPVQFSQGAFNAVVRDLPYMVADARAAAAVVALDHQAALGKIVMQGAQIADLQDRLAALEARLADQADKSSDAGNVVQFEPGVLRHVASA